MKRKETKSTHWKILRNILSLFHILFPVFVKLYSRTNYIPKVKQLKFNSSLFLCPAALNFGLFDQKGMKGRDMFGGFNVSIACNPYI